jgi:BirA family biotin operon repressor/biotin-[acetyl-CoA-carboxylase] ligase
MPAPTPQLATPATPLDAAALTRAGFATVIHRPEAASTMDEARALSDHAPLPAVVVADRQAAGRGRRGAGWWQAPGALAASIVIDGRSGGGPQPAWSLACGVALAETIAALEPDLEPLVRWPNDLEVSGRKLAGILVETAADRRVVVGLGVNTAGTAADAPRPIAHRVATLPDLVGRPLDHTRLLAGFLPRWLDLLAAIAADPLALERRYRPRCALAGRWVTLHVGAARHEGICRGITPTGGLVLETASGLFEGTAGSLTAPGDVWTGG